MKRSFYVFIVFQRTPKHPRTVDHRILIRRALLLPEYRINYLLSLAVIKEKLSNILHNKVLSGKVMLI
jgi:hypothetical protein